MTDLHSDLLESIDPTRLIPIERETGRRTPFGVELHPDRLAIDRFVLAGASIRIPAAAAALILQDADNVQN
jgi:hypothetical protein